MSILHVIHKIVNMDESVPPFHQRAKFAIVLLIIFEILQIFVRVVDIG